MLVLKRTRPGAEGAERGRWRGTGGGGGGGGGWRAES